MKHFSDQIELKGKPREIYLHMSKSLEAVTNEVYINLYIDRQTSSLILIRFCI